MLQAARFFALEGLRDRAIDTLRQAILANPRDVELLSLLADLLSRSGAFEESDRVFRQALDLDAGHAETWYRHGLHAGRQGHLAEARTSYGEAVAKDPRHVRAWVNLGLVRADLGEKGDARRALERAVIVDPACAEAHTNLGILYMEAGLREEAVA